MEKYQFVIVRFGLVYKKMSVCGTGVGRSVASRLSWQKLMYPI